MHQAERQAYLLTDLQFGFGPETLYVRLDGARPIRDLLENGHRFALKFLRPDGLSVAIQKTTAARGLVATLMERGADGSWSARPSSVKAAAGTVLEVAVPLASIGVRPGGGPLSFFIAVQDAHGAELERHPTHHPIEVQVPDHRFEAINWTA
jgi:hypothetical protein